MTEGQWARRRARCEYKQIHSCPGPSKELFRGSFARDPFGNPDYDVSRDGKKLLMVPAPPSTQNSLMVVLNWTAELEQTPLDQ